MSSASKGKKGDSGETHSVSVESSFGGLFPPFQWFKGVSGVFYLPLCYIYGYSGSIVQKSISLHGLN